MSEQFNPKIKSDIEIRETLQKNRSLSDKLSDSLVEKIINKPNVKPRDEVLAKLTDEQLNELRIISENSIAGFIGQLDELESALGMLIMGHHFGWKVLYLIHSKKTIRKYEDILGIQIRDIFPATGPSSYRSAGLALAMKASNFWKIVSGEQKIDKLREIDQ